MLDPFFASIAILCLAFAAWAQRQADNAHWARVRRHLATLRRPGFTVARWAYPLEVSPVPQDVQ